MAAAAAAAEEEEEAARASAEIPIERPRRRAAEAGTRGPRKGGPAGQDGQGHARARLPPARSLFLARARASLQPPSFREALGARLRIRRTGPWGWGCGGVGPARARTPSGPILQSRSGPSSAARRTMPFAGARLEEGGVTDGARARSDAFLSFLSRPPPHFSTPRSRTVCRVVVVKRTPGEVPSLQRCFPEPDLLSPSLSRWGRNHQNIPPRSSIR
ncbi:uncharacterized protein LOC131185342 isoform X2 [Ahaetulla prasina]|uniref:uncharacterized protein LOC131185342 isoform X2 n=1 Tax=Ahaetulla prasina TaxID=499056 RepID=UPI002647748F|nr:uncharacterized protein LOC131185342 isoform X2 [Ahaetulla prasina]